MSDHQPTGTHCQNCGAALQGPYCHQCGQHDFDAGNSFGHVAHEALEGFFHWDGKFFRGAYELLFRPGKLTQEYNAGKRASQIPPLRLYIFVSVLFFIAPEASAPSESEYVDHERVAAAETPAAQPGVAGTKRRRPPSGNVVINFDGQDKWGKFFEEKAAHTDRFLENFHHYLPRALLICLPLFALMSRVVFRRAGYSFLQHLVLSLHLHAFFFLFTLVSGGWQELLALYSPLLSRLLYLASAVYIVVYAYRSLRRVFGDLRRRGTILRGGLLLGSYAMVLLAMVGLTALLALCLA